MSRKVYKLVSLLLAILFIFQQSGFAQVAAQLDIASHLSALHSSFVQDKFRPLHLRYLQYNLQENTFRLLLDKGDTKELTDSLLQDTSKTLLKYFLIGLSLPNDSFWVNLRPDSPDNIIDPFLEQTDIGRIMLETDLQLKKDTAQATSPQTPGGKEYWDKLYQKAEELFGNENITIPTLTRPWIVPDEIIVRETADSAYVYKATLKVMLEQDYLKDSATYSFNDPRLKALNEYSSQLIRELIIPKLTKEVNSAKRYAPLRQVYYSLIMAQWFKARFAGKDGQYARLINTKNLASLTCKESYSKDTYFKEYQKSFKDGEYNIKEPAYTAFGQVIRSYFSGGMRLLAVFPAQPGGTTTEQVVSIAAKGMPAPASGPIIYGYYLNGEIAVNLSASRQEEELRKEGPGLTDNERKGFIHAHEIFHALVAKKGIQFDLDLKTSKAKEEEMANIFARLVFGIAHNGEEAIFTGLVQDKQIQQLSRIRYIESTFLVQLAGILGTEQIERIKNEQINELPEGAQAMMTDNGGSRGVAYEEVTTEIITGTSHLTPGDLIRSESGTERVVLTIGSGRAFCSVNKGGKTAFAEMSADEVIQAIRSGIAKAYRLVVTSSSIIQNNAKSILSEKYGGESFSRYAGGLAAAYIGFMDREGRIVYWGTPEMLRIRIPDLDSKLANGELFDFTVRLKVNSATWEEEHYEFANLGNFHQVLIPAVAIQQLLCSIAEAEMHLRQKIERPAAEGVEGNEGNIVTKAVDMGGNQRNEFVTPFVNAAWITAGSFTYKVLVSNGQVIFQRYDTKNGTPLGYIRTLALEEPFSIGRSNPQANKYVINDPQLAPLHFIVTITQDATGQCQIKVVNAQSSKKTSIEFDLLVKHDTSMQSGVSQVGTRKNIVDSDEEFNEEEKASLLEYIKTAGQTKGSVPLPDSQKLCQLVTFTKGDAIDQLFQKKGISGACNVEDGEGNIIIIIESGLADYRNALEHEILEIGFRELLQKEIRETPESEKSINRMAHILAWSMQIVRLQSKDIFDPEAWFIRRQLEFMSTQQLQKIVDEYEQNLRVFHQSIRSNFFTAAHQEKIAYFERTIYEYAKILIQSKRQNTSQQTYGIMSSLDVVFHIGRIQPSLSGLYLKSDGDGLLDIAVSQGPVVRASNVSDFTAHDGNLYIVHLNSQNNFAREFVVVTQNGPNEIATDKLPPQVAAYFGIATKQAGEGESSTPQDTVEIDFNGPAQFTIGGANSNAAIDALTEITGISISEIERRARPGEYSTVGFLNSTERLKEVLKKDNTTVRSQRLTHKQLAEVLRMAVGSGHGLDYEFAYNGKRFRVQGMSWRGMQQSIFEDGLGTNKDYIVTDTATGKRIHFSGLLPDYIERYGFYEGHTGYRLEPQDVIDLFGLAGKKVDNTASEVDLSGTATNTAVRPEPRHRIMTNEDIDRRINEIPRNARPGIGFPMDLSQGFIIYYNYQQGTITLSNVTGFIASGGKLYVAHLNSQKNFEREFIVVTSDGYSAITEKELPFEVATYFNADVKQTINAHLPPEIRPITPNATEAMRQEARRKLEAGDYQAGYELFVQANAQEGIEFVTPGAWTTELQTLSANAYSIRRLLGTIPGKENYFDDADVYLLGLKSLPGELNPLRYNKPPLIVMIKNNQGEIIGYMYAIEAEPTLSSTWLREHTYNELTGINGFNYEIARNSFYIAHWAVHSDYQNKGIGFLLARKLMERAKERGIKYITGATHPDHIGILRQDVPIYESNDFKRSDGNIRRAFFLAIGAMNGAGMHEHGPRFLKINGTVCGAFDPTTGKVYLDFQAIHEALPAITRAEALDLLYLHEVFHELIERLGITVFDEENLVNALAKEKVGLSLTKEESFALINFREDKALQDKLTPEAQNIFGHPVLQHIGTINDTLGDFILQLQGAVPGISIGLDNVQAAKFTPEFIQELVARGAKFEIVAAVRDTQDKPPKALTANSRVVEAVKKVIADKGGKITFHEYMRICLYEEGAGYYSGGTVQITGNERGAGDFITHPEELSPHFGKAVAKQLFQMWQNMERPDNFAVVEMGAGNGRLARDILDAAKEMGDPTFFAAIRYKIIEVSPSLRERQRSGLLQAYAQQIEWVAASAIDVPLREVEGVFISNELPDAFPVHRVKIGEDGKLKEAYVVYDEPRDSFTEAWDIPSSPEVAEYVANMCALENLDSLEKGIEVPVNLDAVKWMKNISGGLKRGYIITIDYSYPDNGSLKTLFSGVKDGRIQFPSSVRTYSGLTPDLADLYRYPGAVDITADVYFPMLTQMGKEAGLAQEGLCLEREFLLRLGISIPEVAKVGNTFFVLVQSRNITGKPPLIGINADPEKSKALSSFLETLSDTLSRNGSGASLEAPRNPEINPLPSSNDGYRSDTMGGIDFRNLPIVTQAMSNLSANINSFAISKISNINLTQEWQDIERLVDSGITPSTERIKEYIQASCYNGHVEQDKKQVVICISDILRMEEERYVATEPVLRDILIVLEASQSAQELGAIFTGIKS